MIIKEKKNMIILLLPYLLFICFNRLSNSFTPLKTINQKWCSNFFSRSKLNMGCDYYIDKKLQIYYHNETIFSYIILQRDKGYYYFTPLLDEDEDGYEIEMGQYIKEALEPRMKPILIYENNTFQKSSFERKYTQMIEHDLHLSNKTWTDINKILKIENRYER